MRVIDTLRTLPNGAPVAPGTEVRVYRDSDDTLLATVTTGNKGEFVYEVDGNPGVVRYEATAGSSQKIHSTRTVMPVGTVDMSALPVLLSSFLDGVVVGWEDDLAVVADGVSMDVIVGAGVATGRGVLYRQEDPVIISIPTASSSSRIDLIAVRFWRAETGDDAGRCELIHRQGTEASNPSAPALVQNGTHWEVPLAHITVDPGVLGIALNKVVDKRLITMPLIPNGSITRDQLATDIAFGIPYVKKGNNTVVVENATRLNLDRGFSVEERIVPPSHKQADVNLDFAEANADNGTSNQPARRDHRHRLAVAKVVKIGARDLSSSVDNQSEITIDLPPVPTVCSIRVFLRVEGGLGTTTQGNLYLRVAGSKGEVFGPYQCDQGVDSSIEAVHIYTTSGGTSLKVAWGWDRDPSWGGTLRVKGGFYHYVCHPAN